MENINNIEVILSSKLFLSYARKEELVLWLTTTVQTAIEKQLGETKKIFLTTLKGSPAIYMS